MTHIANKILGKRGLEFLVILLAVLRVLAYFNSYHWFADLLSNYMFQYLFWGFFLGAVMARLESWIYCAIAFAVAAVSLVQVAGSTYKVPSVHIPKPSFTVMLFNAQHTNSNYNDIRLWIFDHREELDMVVLQEATPGLAYQTRTLAPFFPTQLEDTSTDDGGTIIISKHAFDTKETFEITFNGIKTHAFHLVTQSPNLTQPMSIYILHATEHSSPFYTDARAYQLDAMARKIAADKSPHIIFAGDLSITPYSSQFSKFENDTGLFEQRNSLLPVPTWPSYGAPWIMQIPVDHILTDKSLKLNGRTVGDAMGSDHLPIVAAYTE